MSPLITVQVGPRNARTDPESGLRFYTWKGTEYPSVTSLRRMAGMPFGLHQWTVSQVVNRAIERYSELGDMLTRERKPRERVVEKNRVKEAAKWLRMAAIEERDLAAKLGTDVHDAATSGADITTVSKDVAPRLHQFYDFLATSGATVVAAEQQVYNLALGYAGTFDLLLWFPKTKRLYLVDIKTGKGIYTEHALQLMGYGMAEFVGEDDVVNERLTRALSMLHGLAILHLTDDGWHWQDVRPSPKLYGAFRGLLTFAKFAHEFAAIDGLIAAERSGAA